MNYEKKNLIKSLEDFKESIRNKVKIENERKFIPTGLQEKIIKAVGENKHFIVKAQMLNKCGKTATLVAIIKNLIWENDKEYFNYPLYNKWAFVDDDGLPSRRIRLVTTPTSAGEAGAFREELTKWFPKGRYEAFKNKKAYFSQYFCFDERNNKWILDVVTHHMGSMELESSVIPLTIIDEPVVTERMIGAITSRSLKGGGMIVAGFTPVEDTDGTCQIGVLIDMLEDLKDKGSTMITVTGNIEENCKETGLPNSKGTKRGLMTPEEIANAFKRIPQDQHRQRLYGESLHNAGKIYRNIGEHNIIEVDYDEEWIKDSEHYMILDPHGAGYPFIMWALFTPPIFNGQSKIIIRHEFPTVRTLGGFYDEKRHTEKCYYTPEQLSNIMKIIDGTNDLGLATPVRIIDPRYARNTEHEYTKSTTGIVDYYTQYGIKFNYPPTDKIASGRDWIREISHYDKSQTICATNEPQLYIDVKCQNSYRCLTKHYYEKENKETEKYKDPVDCLRMFGAFIGYKKHMYRKPHKKDIYEEYKQKQTHLMYNGIKIKTFDELFKETNKSCQI